MARKESNDLLQQFIEQVPISIAMFDTEMRYLAASRRHCEDLNLVGKEIIGRSHYEVVPELAEPWREAHHHALAGESIKNFRVTHSGQDGNEAWVQWVLQPWHKSDGSIGGILLFTQNLMDLEKAEVELRDREELLRESQRIASIGSLVVDFQTKEHKCSEMFDRIFGIDQTYPHTKEGISALIHPDDFAVAMREITEKAIGQFAPLDLEHRIIRFADRSVRWIRALSKMECDSVGHPLKLRITVQDITEQHEAEVALAESRNLLQLFIDQAPVSIAMYDTQMRYLAASRAHRERYKITHQDYIGRALTEVLPFMPQGWIDAHRGCLADKQVRKHEGLIELPDGTKKWLQWELHPWVTGEGAVGGLLAFSIDVTERRRAEEKQRLAAQVFTHAREGIMITDADGTIVDVNDMFTEITGYTREEVLGRNPRLLKSSRQKKEFYAGIWRSLNENGNWSGEIWNRDKSGHDFAEMLTISAVPDENGGVQQYVALFSDITNLKKKEQLLKQLAHYDALTGLPNRVLMMERLNLAMTRFHPLKNAMTNARRRGELMAVAFLDLDAFKGINDHYGHDVGDQLLTAVASRMKSTLRERDTLARVGGDEFVAVMLDLENRDTCVGILNRLISAAARPITIGIHDLQVSVSVGLTFYPQAEEVTADQLMRQADQAMYRAKVSGKDQYHIFDLGQDSGVSGRHVDIDHIRQALDKKEFELYYQPLVNMREGKVVGAEALIRWHHPDRGLLLPGVFLPVIEDHSLSVEIGEWVIDSVLAQMECWQASGLEIPVSLNVAARQLQESNFIERLSRLLTTHSSVKPSSLRLEIMETNVLQNREQISEILEGCRKMGVSLALDDFGSGFSSLSYLRYLPADVLKIDWSFVRDILTSPEDLTLIEGIISLAATFRRLVVAEGVETTEHGLMLLRMGCELAQGFGIARPMPAAVLPEWIAGWKPDPQWNDVLPSNTQERQLLHAAVAHRFWLAAIEMCLEGERHVLPEVSLGQCQFSRWIAENDRDDQDNATEILELDHLHKQVHALAGDLVRSKPQNREIETMVRLSELRESTMNFLNRLLQFKTQTLSR